MKLRRPPGAWIGYRMDWEAVKRCEALAYVLKQLGHKRRAEWVLLVAHVYRMDPVPDAVAASLESLEKIAADGVPAIKKEDP